VLGEEPGLGLPNQHAKACPRLQTKFREAGLLHRGNIPKNLGNNPEFFGSVDGRWFLKQGGKDAVAKLIAEAKGEKVTA
jgi:hypothetical protein